LRLGFGKLGRKRIAGRFSCVGGSNNCKRHAANEEPTSAALPQASHHYSSSGKAGSRRN
jgi:hypothetical protein